MSSEYPVRADTHISESKSLALLRQSLPSHWIIREVGERDYGLDIYVEIVGVDKRLRGDLVAIQLKSQAKVEFSKSSTRKYTTLYTIKRATLNYWLGMPVPVFVCLVCLSTERCYWVNIKRRYREGAYSRTTRTQLKQKQAAAPNPAIRIEMVDNFSLSHLNRFLRSYEIERKWPEIEVAIERGLTSYTSLGPLVLMCKRNHPKQHCSTTLQYLINSHWETFRTLSMYLEGGSPTDLSHWYEENARYAKAERLTESYNFYFHTVWAMFNEMLNGYRDCLITAYDMVTTTHKEYFDQRFPLLRTHLESRPLTFLADDWYPRYFFDEYENETKHPEKLFFEDFTEYDRVLNDLLRS
ncbi:DUF4365 domain-containing protein [Acetobacter nitrogenifigens]|uniref:DUF4365 domain-containing protein n=1 Tax=Acetobacter nitrogenifigens DSM 23921 = NBRC 105050 TaxID=1120919 RepID=A0A511XAF2_9PROT|nr:DUF4365 domain-containing protein [Acetobacter nitrogenifigens]GEN59895.1 hypothetical protein ANI02nite_17790 [Acetobacter nitrogenifigens DSM 23921 = NBRC 105050]